MVSGSAPIDPKATSGPGLSYGWITPSSLDVSEGLAYRLYPAGQSWSLISSPRRLEV
jgi:hypothetical protein